MPEIELGFLVCPACSKRASVQLSVRGGGLVGGRRLNNATSMVAIFGALGCLLESLDGALVSELGVGFRCDCPVGGFEKKECFSSPAGREGIFRSLGPLVKQGEHEIRGRR